MTWEPPVCERKGAFLRADRRSFAPTIDPEVFSGLVAFAFVAAIVASIAPILIE